MFTLRRAEICASAEHRENNLLWRGLLVAPALYKFPASLTPGGGQVLQSSTDDRHASMQDLTPCGSEAHPTPQPCLSTEAIVGKSVEHRLKLQDRIHRF